MGQHLHPRYMAGCFRCDLSREEALDAQRDMLGEFRALVARLSLDDDDEALCAEIADHVGRNIR